MIPIWETTYYTTTADTFEYTIEDENGNEIFSGKAYKMPGQTYLKINLNDICAPYLGDKEMPSPVWTNVSGSTLTLAVKEFPLIDSAGTYLVYYRFLDDWTYTTASTSSLTTTINGHYAPNMICLNSYTELDQSDDPVGVLSWGPGNVVPGYDTVACGNAALYYKTRRGGWASFLIEGLVKRYDDYAWSKYKKYNPSTEGYGRGETVYLNEIQPRWELNTSLLTDEQSRVLAEDLLSSPCVYLHLLADDEIYPITITNTNTEYKTYRANKKKRVSYQITATAANKRIRR